LANNEVEFMILDGVMVILASICMTVWHPGYGFQKQWNNAGFRFRIPKIADDEEDPQIMGARAWEGQRDEVEPKVSAAVTAGSPATSQKE
jgi:hypothetical protein